MEKAGSRQLAAGSKIQVFCLPADAGCFMVPDSVGDKELS
jgi:hypothetical protein